MPTHQILIHLGFALSPSPPFLLNFSARASTAVPPPSLRDLYAHPTRKFIRSPPARTDTPYTHSSSSSSSLLFSSAMLPEQEGVDSVPTFLPTSRLLCIYRYHLQTKDRSDSSFMYHQAM
ncbi:hypothetical protein K525DRAFT_253776 [Schizophyllum commune Loenen D]|nr:hypothetical protein K525DRAFT_253776 [Schizophyllum commune Loenen D]